MNRKGAHFMRDPGLATSSRIGLESGVRRYARPTWRHWLRRRRLAGLLASVGENVYVERNVEFLRHPEHVSLGAHVIVKEGARICPTNPDAVISIGDWTTIGYHTFIFASASITIGSDCLIAPFCYFVDSNHGLKRDVRIREQPMSVGPIVVEDDVWLGAGVTVLRGVRIGRGAVIGASTVVSADVPPYAIVSGSPAIVTGYRQ
jgi:acetyltransferase-like isoleucine patch superfamily enzyme